MDGRSELLFSDLVRRGGEDPRRLRDGVQRGHFVRVRRGVYVAAELWRTASDLDRHVLSINAVMSGIDSPALVAGRSAGTLWGVPFSARWPAPVSLLVPWPGGGSSMPGVLRSAEGWERAPHAEAGGMPVTARARTVIDIARRESPDRAIALLDWARSSKRVQPLSFDELQLTLTSAEVRRGAALARRALEASTNLSESIGESLARLAILRLGFEAPRLQVEFTDAQGSMFPDFYWDGVSIAAEFDGKVKYTREEYTGGDPAAVVWKEKLREDRLRRLVRSVVRLVWSDVKQPAQLASLLSDAGVPRLRDPRRRVL